MSEPLILEDGLQLRPLTARSVVLSTLLGEPRGAATAHELVRVGREFGVQDTTLRASLSRMVSAGDLVRNGSDYRLSPRLAERQRLQDAAATPAPNAWDGTWQMVVVTTTGRPSVERVDLRSRLRRQRLGELREGVWMRPSNLTVDLRGVTEVELFTGARTKDDCAVVVQLWDLEMWARTARALATGYRDATSDANRFTIVAAIVRHLLDEPNLPPELNPPEYPAARLRDIYTEYRAELQTRRHRPDASW